MSSSRSSQSVMRNLMMMDNKFDVKRQERLHEINPQHLQIDESKPPTQQIIRLNNFLESGSEQVFSELLRNLAGTHPDEQINRLAKEYLLIEKNIDNTKQSYLNELEQEVEKQIEVKKQEITKVMQEIKRIKAVVDKHQQNCEVLKEQIITHKDFVQKNKEYLEKLPAFQKNSKEEGEKFQAVVGGLLELTQNKLRDYENLYKNIINMMNTYDQLNQQWKQKNSQLHSLNKDLELIKSSIIKAQLQIEQLHETVRNEQLELEKQKKSKEQEQEEQKNNTEYSQNSTSRYRQEDDFMNDEETVTKYYLSVKKQKKRDWVFVVLVLCTVGLFLATLGKIL